MTTVQVTYWPGGPDEDDTDQPEGWRVYLPHQCDTWDIAGGYGSPSTAGQAIEDLEAFAADVQAALAALRSGQTYGEGDRW